MTGHRSTGYVYEQKAAQYLESRGYRILEKNFTIRGGEIDLIARDPSGDLVFAEVKYRARAMYGNPLESVDYHKQQRLLHAARVYLYRQGYPPDTPCRFDVLSMVGQEPVEHLKNAFGGQ